MIFLLISCSNSFDIKAKYVKPFPKISYTKIHQVYYSDYLYRKKINKPYAAKFFKEIIFNNAINIFILINSQLYNTFNIYNLTNINL